MAEAEDVCNRILAAAPDDAEANYLAALIAFEKDSAELAETHLLKAIAAKPDDPDFHCLLGNAQYMLGRLESAADHFQQSIVLDPSLTQAGANLGLVLIDLGRPADAIPVLEQALSGDPDNTEILLNLGNALLESGDIENAVHRYRQVIQNSPDHAGAYRNLGNAFVTAKQFDEAEAAYRNCLRLDPQSTEVFTDLGLVLVAKGKLEEAARHFIEPIKAFRAIGPRPLDEFVEFNRYNKTKLKHDIDQLNHLINQKKVSKDYLTLIDEYREIYDRLGDCYEGKLSALNPPASQLLQNTYNRIVYHENSPLIEGGTLSPSLDTEEIEAQFFENPHGFTFFDGLLRDEALQALRAFCLNSTVWSLLDYEDEIETNLLTGFSCPLIFQIAMDIKSAFPKLFGAYPFTSCWAYKYFKNKSGLGVHCDDGAASINFWVTPDEANNDPKTGGLVMWNKKVSREFLGEMSEQKQSEFQKVIAEPDAESFHVPYGCNRAVLFHSNVLHGTDDIDFKPGYENHRINMTFLYGKSPKPGNL